MTKVVPYDARSLKNRWYIFPLSLCFQGGGQVSPGCPHFLTGCLGQPRLLQNCRESATDVLSGGGARAARLVLAGGRPHLPHLSLINLVREPPRLAAQHQNYIPVVGFSVLPFILSWPFLVLENIAGEAAGWNSSRRKLVKLLSGQCQVLAPPSTHTSLS